ncbi:MAG: amino acid racemase [Acidobacteria bacterium]|nr:amino acid racemase [Acidobacteriota bacterium]MBI3427376.1 amino acid racemase [Acidobacteriota bacterium]
MKTVGIIGGIAPESTIAYYRAIIAAYRAQQPDGNYPALLLNSINLKNLLELVGANQRAELVAYLVDELHKLARAGADFAVLASNTPHLVFDELQRVSPLPLLSIVEATRDVAQRLGLQRVGLFGTRFTMQGGFYQEIFGRAGIDIVLPDAAEQAYIHEKYLGELAQAVLLPETRAGLLAIADRLRAQQGIEALILGGTELPLILTEAAHEGLPFLDTTNIHVARIVAQMLS